MTSNYSLKMGTGAHGRDSIMVYTFADITTKEQLMRFTVGKANDDKRFVMLNTILNTEQAKIMLEVIQNRNTVQPYAYLHCNNQRDSLEIQRGNYSEADRTVVGMKITLRTTEQRESAMLETVLNTATCKVLENYISDWVSFASGESVKTSDNTEKMKETIETLNDEIARLKANPSSDNEKRLLQEIADLNQEIQSLNEELEECKSSLQEAAQKAVEVVQGEKAPVKKRKVTPKQDK